ncbi:hypothetical protein HDU92_007360 [Lobulomyces angularis]|nr:hypothetical protein HDU92_007360 [Lobulomyces angularis]
MKQSFPQLKTIFSSSNYPRVSHSSSESTLPNFIATVIHSLTSIKTNKIPNRSLVEYIRFILSSTKVSASTIITSLKYLQRLSYQFKIVQGQEWKLYLTSLILSDSFLSDSPFELKCWIKLGGIKGSELAILKTFFLNSISFRLFVDDTEYFGWLSVLEMDLTKFNCNRNQSIFLDRYPYHQYSQTKKDNTLNNIKFNNEKTFSIHNLNLVGTKIKSITNNEFNFKLNRQIKHHNIKTKVI